MVFIYQPGLRRYPGALPPDTRNDTIVEYPEDGFFMSRFSDHGTYHETRV